MTRARWWSIALALGAGWWLVLAASGWLLGA